MFPALLLAADAQGSSVLNWIMTLSGDNRAFPLMDLVASEVEDIDAVIDQLDASLAQFDDDAPGVRLVEEAVARESAALAKDAEAEARLAEWLVSLNWFGLVSSRGRGARILSGLVGRFSPGLGASSASCDAADSEQDLDYVERVHKSLDRLETLPLEDNEFKWADFFVRHRYRSAVCAFGVASLFLVAGDVTAYASSAAGGEHMRRLRRAVLFAQGLSREQLLAAPPSARSDVLRTRWPIWRLLSSVQAELAAGHAAMPNVERDLVPRPLPTALPAVRDEGVYLSVIVQCRNDDYGGNMLARLNRMLTTATFMLHSAGVPAEIIIVEWNPPLGAAPIADVIERAEGTKDAVPIRVIRVPTEVHMSLPHHKAHPVFEHIAENVAFRRARGRFVLKTNIDNIMSLETVLFIARRDLREDASYRATYAEFDFTEEADGLEPGPLLEWLFSQQKLLREMNFELADLSSKYPEDTHVCERGASSAARAASEPRPFYWAGSGDFVLASRALLLHVRGYPQIAQNWQTDDLIHCRLRAVGAQQVILQPPCVTVHQNHRRINRVRSSTRWVVTDSNFKHVCGSPFEALPTESGHGDDWGFASMDFEERVV